MYMKSVVNAEATLNKIVWDIFQKKVPNIERNTAEQTEIQVDRQESIRLMEEYRCMQS